MSQVIRDRDTSAAPTYLARLWNLRTVAVFAGGVALVTGLAVLLGRDNSEPTIEGDWDLAIAQIFGALALMLIGVYLFFVRLATRGGYVPAAEQTDDAPGRRAARAGGLFALAFTLFVGEPTDGITQGVWQLLGLIALAGLTVGLIRHARTSGVAWAVGVVLGSLIGGYFWYLASEVVLP